MVRSEIDEEVAVINVFLREAVHDRESGGLRSLTEYQERYQAHAGAIAREFGALGGSDSEPAPAVVPKTGAGPSTPLPAGPPISNLTLGAFLDANPGDDLAQAEAFARLLGDALEASQPGVPAAPDAGECFGPYRILGEIGRGGQGVVLLAEDSRLPRVVALKLLQARWPESGQALARFRREAEATSKLDHAGICTVYETGLIEGLPFIAMRYIEGETLGRRFERARQDRGDSAPNRQDVAALLLLFERAARALHAAHEAGIVHRDIKPGNVMVTSDGLPVLLDFGLARDDEGGAAVTLTGDVLGTPAYIAPEQLGAAGRAPADRRVDIWSLGVALYEGVCGRKPFEGATREGLFRAILSEAFPDPQRVNPAIGRDLKVVLETALAKEPGRRYSTAESLAEDLRRIRGHEPILAKPPGTVVRLVRWAQRKPAAAAAIVLLLAGTGVSTTFALRAERNLADWTRLADAQRLADLVAQADGPLWPPLPSKIEALEGWLVRARELAARLAAHETALADLRQLSLPYDAAAEAADRTANEAAYERLKDIERTLQELEHGNGGDRRASGNESPSERIPGSRRSPAQWESRTPARVRPPPERLAIMKVRLERDRGELERLLAERRTWAYTDSELSFKHARLTSLVDSLRSFQGAAGAHTVTIADLEQRLELARSLDRRLEGEDRDAWSECIADVGRPDPPYHGLALRPRWGLVPLGRDKDSGYWEFWHMMSGTRPRWVGTPLGPGHVELAESGDGEGIVLVLIPAGSFAMGAWSPFAERTPGSFDPQTEAGANLDEEPVHQVDLDAFLISKFECTQAQWQRLWRENPSLHKTGRESRWGARVTSRHPVSNVNWGDCMEACRRWGLLLPTEAQWEYVCRGGTTTSFHTGQDVSSLIGFANFADAQWGRVFPEAGKFEPGLDDGWLEAAPVGSFRPNGFGLHDVHGNVQEWARDCYRMYHNYDPRPGDGQRVSPFAPGGKVARGGSFTQPPLLARSARRRLTEGSAEDASLGLRPSMALER